MTESTTPDYSIDEEQNEHEGIEVDEINGGTVFSAPNEDTIIFKRSHLYAALIPLAFVLGLSVGFLLWGRANESSTVATAASAGAAEVSNEGAIGATQNEQAQAGQNPVSNAGGGEQNSADGANQGQTASGADASAGEAEAAVKRYEIPLDGDPQLGPDDAPITIVEFSDYECPYCRKFHVETFYRIIEAYPDQIQFVYRDFPLASIHSNAISAAEAAGCAFEQDLFWEYHDRLFSMEQGLGQAAYIKYAGDLGLDLDAFQDCIDSRQYQAEVQADYDFAAQLGIRSTPTFFINGLAVVGAQPFEIFQQIIDRELAGEIP